jgi:hypothetical protein
VNAAAAKVAKPTIGMRLGLRSARDRAQRVEQARRRRDEHDCAAADVEGLAQLGFDRLHRVERELVERDQQPEHHEHANPAQREGVAQADRLGIDAGKKVVREDDLFAGPGLGLLASGLLVEDGSRE